MLLILRSVILLAATAVGVAYWPVLADESAPDTASVIAGVAALPPIAASGR